MLFTMVGPLDKPGMDVTGMIEYVSLTLSPPVMRLIIHAVKTLIPQEVGVCVCMCVCVCVCVCVHACMRVCVRVCMCVCMYESTCVGMHG